VTTVLERPGRDGRGSGATAAHAVPMSHRRRLSRVRKFLHEPAWPVVALLAGWPLWWALGLPLFIPVILAIPMVKRMYVWRATGARRLRFPPGFALWALFLLVMVLGLAVVGLEAPHTIPSPVSHRAASWLIFAVQYFAVTVLLIYAGNLTESELPRRRLAWLLGLVGIYAIVGGLAGVVAPGFSFASPLAHVIPQSIQNADTALGTMLHPSLTQFQGFQGHGRPSAPFTYTNGWGDAIASLLPWLVVGWIIEGTSRSRRIAAAALSVSIVPIVFSVDRGLWVALVLSGLYLALRLAVRPGAKKLRRRLLAVFVLIVIVVLVSPLKDTISSRASHGSSNTGRLNLAVLAWQGALESPVLGYGDTRHEMGSATDITASRSKSCQQCGNADIGAHGQIWLLLFANGFPGAFFYLGFFCYGVWRYRRDKTPYGLAGVLVILLGFVFMWVYQQVGASLMFTMLAYVMLWKNDREMRREETPLESSDGQVIRADPMGRAITAGASSDMLAPRPGVTARWTG
jgi:O-Antigen ligase